MDKPDFSTTWIFSAIYIFGDDDISLSQLIGSADGLNHAIPTEDEICSALGYLESHGLVKVANEIFHVTAYGKELFSAAKKRRGGWFKIPDNVLFIFNKNLDYDKEVNARQYNFINDATINTAYEEYVNKSRSS